MGHDQQHIKDRTQHAHAHHGLARALEREHERNEQACHQCGPPHHRDGVGRQRTGNDAAAFKIGHHPAGNALLRRVLAEQKAGQQPEARRVQKAPVDGLFRPGCFLTPAAQRSKSIHQPEHQAQHCQQKHCQCGVHPCRRCNEEGAHQCTAGVAAVHQVHAPGAAGRVIADQNGAGVHDAALGDAHQKKCQRQHRHGTRQAHQTVAHRIADGQQQHAAFHAQRTGQHAHQKPGDQVADAHEREQGAGHAVGKAVLFLQKADHNASADGADAAEEEGKKACIPQACRLLFHNRPLSVKISSFYLTIIPPHCNRIFLQKVAKSPPGSDDLKCPPRCSGHNSRKYSSGFR